MSPVKFFKKISDRIANLKYYFNRLPGSAALNAPYISQFMSANLVEKYINDKPSLATDPRWEESGAKTIEEYQMWTWSDCGITCFKMILSAIDHKHDKLTLVEIAKGAKKFGAFEDDPKMPSGLHYQEFCNYVTSKFDLSARPEPNLSLQQIKHEVSLGNFVIVSVNPNIRYPESPTPVTRGGHLILVVGYNDAKGGIYIHNPSGYQSNKSQNRALVTYTQFKKFFAGRGVIIEKP
ncbi:MAG: C39 family peptidase [Candidatus Vogelbacteria bacterium]|nr:C39 family peptidase [Candidatus Vogelbacteria bacterium]